MKWLLKGTLMCPRVSIGLEDLLPLLLGAASPWNCLGWRALPPPRPRPLPGARLHPWLLCWSMKPLTLLWLGASEGHPGLSFPGGWTRPLLRLHRSSLSSSAPSCPRSISS